MGEVAEVNIHLDKEALEAAQCQTCSAAGNGSDGNDGGGVGQNVADGGIDDEPVDGLAKCRKEAKGEQNEEAAG